VIRIGQNQSIRRFPVKDHYNAVRKSDLYEYAGISKPLLMLIAGLIIDHPADGKEADPDAGWCVAKQRVLAAMIGCSREEVVRQVKKFKKDGWLTVETFRDDDGHQHCKYAMTPEQLKKIKERAMHKDDEGHYIRARQPKSARKNGYKNLTSYKKFHDESSPSLVTHGHQAKCDSVTKPCDNPSTSVVAVAVVVPSLVENTEVVLGSKATSKPDSLRSKEGKNNQSPGAQGNTSPAVDKPRLRVPLPSGRAPVRNYLQAAPAVKLRDAGCPEEVIAEITKLEYWSGALNDTANPITAYVTLALKENGPANRLSRIWMPKPKAHGVIIHGDADFDFGVSESEKNTMMKQRAQMTDDQRERETAWFWWGMLEMPERKKLNVTTTWKDDMGTYNEAEVIAAYRAAEEAKAAKKAARA
jgi:biotin operon repressor